MTTEEEAKLRDFLFRYWFDRPKDDQDIILEVVMEEKPESVKEYIRLLYTFLESGSSDQDKAAFIIQTLRKRFPDRVTAPVLWLRCVATMLGEASQ